jgi:integrase
MSVRKIGKSWRVDIRYQHTRYRLKSPENSKAGAEAYEATLRQKLARGEPIEPDKQTQAMARPTFKEFAEKWYRIYVQNNNKPSEQNTKSLTLGAHLYPWFGSTTIDKITALQIEEYKASKLKTGLAEKTVNNHLIILSKCLRTAQDWAVISTMPKVQLLKVPPSRFDFLTQEESEKLLKSVNQPLWHDMILLALRTGLRFGEIIALEWSDIDFEAQVLNVRRSIVGGVIGSPKSNKTRCIPLTNDVIEMLRKRQHAKGPVFDDSVGQVVNYFTARDNLTKLCKSAGLRAIGWHTLRHSFASQLVAKGVPIISVQILLGHSDIRMTTRYAHLAPSTLREAVILLESNSRNFGHQMGTEFATLFDSPKKKALNRALFPTFNLVGPVGIEPTTHGLKGRCSTN